MKDCVFCKIVKGEIPSEKIKETDNLVAFKSNEPKADVHILIVPKKHFDDVTSLDDGLWVEMKKMGLEVAKEKGINNFRLVTNAGGAALVKHMHIHLLGEISIDRNV